MVSHHLEREVKLDAPAGAVPDLAVLPGVAEVRTTTHTLEASYFDTEDLALARARTTLRRRTGGTDDGWHLKRPEQDGVRTETHLPLGRATKTVPAPLRALVRAVVRDRPLVKVATVVNERAVHELVGADGVVLAEVCDDRVRGTAHAGPAAADGEAEQSWREWEVELRDGDPDVLDVAVTALQEAGASPSASASKLQRVLGSAPTGGDRPARGGLKKNRAGVVVWEHLAEQVDRLQACDPLVRTDEPDSVHAMRVATRRLRSALKTFRPLLDRSVTDPVRDELKVLGQVLGEARDAEVMRDRIGATVADLDEELVLGPVTRRLHLELEQRYQEAHREVVAFLDGERYLRLLDALDGLLLAPPWTGKASRKAPDVLARRVTKAYRDVAAEVGRATALPPGAERDAALHEARKAAKRARYAAETVAPAFGASAERFAEALEAVQDALGEHQDAVVAQGLLREIGVRAHLAGENAFTFGLLHGLEQHRARAAEDAFERTWAAASTRRLRRWADR